MRRIGPELQRVVLDMRRRSTCQPKLKGLPALAGRLDARAALCPSLYLRSWGQKEQLHSLKVPLLPELPPRQEWSVPSRNAMRHGSDHTFVANISAWLV